MSRHILSAGIAAAAMMMVGSSLLAQQPQDLPRFTSAVEVTSLDISVLDAQGTPVTDLKADDFVVTIDKVPRRVVSADWVPLQTAPDRAAQAKVPAGYSSNEGAAGGRLIVIVVDQPNIRLGGTLGIRRAVNGFIDRLQPSDRAAVIGLGLGAPSTSFTSDRERLKKTIDRLVGLFQPAGLMLHNISLTEAKEIEAGNPGRLTDVANRECNDMVGAPLDDTQRDACTFEIENEAREIAQRGANDGQSTIRALRALLTALRTIDAPKTLLFVSEGFMVADMQVEVAALGSLAAAARTSIYSLKLDDTLFSLDAAARRPGRTAMDDRALRAEGMEILSGASRGTMINVLGTGANVFARIEQELAGYYLVGAESGAADKDGKPHQVSVDIKRRGLTVRTRRTIITSDTAVPVPRNPREAVAAALGTPLPMAALPIRVATYSLQGPEAGRVQLLIHADVGSDYASPRVVAMGYVITDLDGRMVENQALTARLPPVMNGVPSALQFAGGASLPPGEYLLKMAIAEGDRVGTVEHPIHAGTTAAGALRVSDLMVGGPLSSGEQLLQPTVGYTVVFGAVHGYVEAYGRGAASVSAKYEIASTADGPALITADVPAYTAGNARAIFTRVLPVRQLPPGRYVLRATLQSGGATIKTLTSGFEVSTPAVLMTSASTIAETAAREVYLPVTEAALGMPFDIKAVVRPDTVASFRQRIDAGSQAMFDKGVRALGDGSYLDAEISFKAAVSADADSAAALAYLAATFAAAGHDLEASSAWQTALVDGSDLPEVYEWLAGALMRNRDLALAKSVLEEAVSKWPSDVRFARPIAMVYATFGQGREAVRNLERYLAQYPNDTEAMLMGVEWIYQLRSSGQAAHSPAEDLTLARRYGAVYAASQGPQTALVEQWLEFLERAPR